VVEFKLERALSDLGIIVGKHNRVRKALADSFKALSEYISNDKNANHKHLPRTTTNRIYESIFYGI
jgi:hypothetical protein